MTASVAGSTLHGFDLPGFMTRERERVEHALERALEWIQESVDPELAAPLRHGVLTGGKRVRPILCVAAFRACGGQASDATYDLGAAVELIHAYSLMHDDLPCMDDAELRRGKPTPHQVYGEEVTALAGAVLIPAAHLQAWRAAVELGCDEDTGREVVAELARAAGAGGMVGGQALDLLAEGSRLSGPEMDALHGMKTGALLAAALRIGALAAGADASVRQGLDRYGRAIGLAFQIADDILDVTASSGELGKHPSDQALDKSTYVSLHGLEQARERAREQVSLAHEALSEVGLESRSLEALAAYIVERER